MPTLRVPFGQIGDRLFEPRQVPNGKTCGCVCPACKRPLIARQRAQTPHFAHEPGQDCAHALETAVHLAAKQLIAARRELRLPIVQYLNLYKKEARLEIICGEQLVKPETVALETWLTDIRPDLIATVAGQPYLVEIAVTHFVDEAKLEKIYHHKIPTFEINASRLKDSFTFTALSELLFSGAYSAHWLYHHQIEQLSEKSRRDYLKEIAIEDENKRQREEKFAKYKDMPYRQKLALNRRRLGLNDLQFKELTSFVPWEGSFGAPREVWQSAVLAYISQVDDRPDPTLPYCVNTDYCLEWLRKVFEIQPQVPDGDKIAVFKYFRHLERLGILEHESAKEFWVVLPPNKWAEI